MMTKYWNPRFTQCTQREVSQELDRLLIEFKRMILILPKIYTIYNENYVLIYLRSFLN